MAVAARSLGPGRVSYLVASALLLLATGAADWATGAEFGFFVFYFAPVALAAWGLGRVPGVAAALVATLVWAGIDAPHYPDRAAAALYWNAGIRLASFLLIGMGMARLRESFERERRLNAHLSTALERVKQLSGLLPICGSCKKIRNDSGYWERLESYIENHSSAEFSHGICPECLERLYRELDERPV